MRAERTWPATAGCERGVDGCLKLAEHRARPTARTPTHTHKLQGQKSHRTLENRTRLAHSGTTRMFPINTSIVDRTVYADIR